ASQGSSMPWKCDLRSILDLTQPSPPRPAYVFSPLSRYRLFTHLAFNANNAIGLMRLRIVSSSEDYAMEPIATNDANSGASATVKITPEKFDSYRMTSQNRISNQ